MILTLDAKRRLTVPAALAPAEPGDHFIAEFDPEEDAIVFRRLAKRADWLAVLKACPVEMNDVPPRNPSTPEAPQAVSWLLDADVLSQPAKKMVAQVSSLGWSGRTGGASGARPNAIRSRAEPFCNTHFS